MRDDTEPVFGITPPSEAERLRGEIEALRAQVRHIDKRMPTFADIMWGHFFGLLLYSIFGVILTALVWLVIVPLLGLGGLGALSQIAKPTPAPTPPAAVDPSPRVKGEFTDYRATEPKR